MMPSACLKRRSRKKKTPTWSSPKWLKASSTKRRKPPSNSHARTVAWAFVEVGAAQLVADVRARICHLRMSHRNHQTWKKAVAWKSDRFRRRVDDHHRVGRSAHDYRRCALCRWTLIRRITRRSALDVFGARAPVADVKWLD